MIIAIDGPAGSGKSTTARQVADQLDFLYLDTGAMYRAVALAFLRAQSEPTKDAAEQILPNLEVYVSHNGGEMQVYLDDENVSSKIRVQEVGAMASRVSSLLPVRQKMVQLQRREAHRQLEETGGVILDGRDIGTEVLPDADVKFFFVADAEVRARRRLNDLSEEDSDVTLEQVLADIRKRDKLDRERQHAPLRKADDAIVIDTTDSSFDEQVAKVVKIIRERQHEKAR